LNKLDNSLDIKDYGHLAGFFIVIAL